MISLLWALLLAKFSALEVRSAIHRQMEAQTSGFRAVSQASAVSKLCRVLARSCKTAFPFSMRLKSARARPATRCCNKRLRTQSTLFQPERRLEASPGQRADTAAGDDDDFGRGRVQYSRSSAPQPCRFAGTSVIKKDRRHGAIARTDDVALARGAVFYIILALLMPVFQMTEAV